MLNVTCASGNYVRARFGIVVLFFSYLIFTLAGCSFNLDVAGSSQPPKPVPAKTMRISIQPGAVYVAGETFNPEPEVTYFDESGNVDPLANRQISATLESNPSSATLGTTLTADPVDGITKFNDLKLTKVGTGYTLKFTNADGLTDVSTPFEIIAAAPARLDISSAPLSFNANECSATPLRYDVVDQFGNTSALTQNLTVNLSGSNLQFFSDAACSTPITLQNLNIGDLGTEFYVSSTQAGSHVLTISAAGMGSDNQVVTVHAAAAGKLAFLGSAQTLVAGVCSAAATIQSQDLFNNPNTVSADTDITLSGTGMTFYQDSTCSGAAVTEVTMPNGAGSVTFYFKGTVAGPITITGAAPGFTSATQIETILSAVATSLAFTVQPSDTVAGVVMAPSVEVSLLDQFGNIATSTAKTITLSIANNPSGTATIVGGNRVKAAVNGVAVFSAPNEIVIQKADVGYTLSASAPGLTAVTSDSFDILGASIETLEYTTGSQTLEAGECSSVVNIVAKDQYGNLARASADTTISMSGSGLSFFSDNTCTTSIPSATIGTGLNSINFYFRGIIAGNPIAKTATVTAGDTAPAISQNHIITPAAPQSVSFISTAQTTEAGVCSGQVEIKVGDIFGNPVPPVADASLSLSASDGATVFYTDASCTAGNEIVAVTLVSGANYGSFYYTSTKSGSNTITVSGSADFGSGSTAVTGSQVATVTASDPDHLEFTTQPPASTLAGASFASSVQVAAKDIYGNICTSYATAIVVDLEDNPPGTGAIVGGAKSVVPVSGIATYSVANDIVINKAASGYSLSASSGTLSNIESSSFDIVAGPATKYRYTAAPADTKAGYCSSGAVTIQTEDTFGNISEVSGAKAMSYAATPSGAGVMQFFSDAGCTTAAPATIADGASTLSFYFKGTTAGGNTMTIQPAGIACDVSMGCATANTKSLTINPDEPYQLAFATPVIVSPNQVEAGACSPAITLRSTDQFGNPVNVGADQVIELTPSSGGMYSDAACTTAIDNGVSPLKILAGSNQASFYFMSTTTGGGQHTSTAESTFSGVYAGGTASPNTSVVAQVNAMKAAPPDRFHILQQPLNSIAGQAILGPFSAELRDRFNNPASTSTAKAYINIGSYSTGSRPTLFGGAGLTAGPNTPTNPVGKNYFPDPPVQSLWSYAVGGQLIYSGTIAVNIQKVGTYSLRLSALGIDYDPAKSESATFDVVNAPASKLAFISTAHTQIAGTCSGQVSVQAQDPYSNSATLGTNTTVTPSGAGMTFYSDAGCTTPVSDVTIANGTHSATFYFKGTTSGTQPLTVQATAGATLTLAVQNQTINPDVPKSLVYFTPARTTAAGACSSVVTVYSKDQFGNNSPLTADSAINFAQTGTPVGSTLQFFSNSGCTTSIGSLTMLTGTYASSFYVKGTVMGSVVLRVTPDFDVTGFVEQTETITAAALSQIAFVTNGSQTLTAGDCSAETTFELRDAYGNAKSDTTTVVRLNTSQPGFLFYTDNTCSTVLDPAAGITVTAGTAQGSFYFKSTISGIPRNIVATVASPAVSATAGQNINPAGFSKLAFTNGTSTITTLSMTAGACLPLTVQGQDEFGNIVSTNLVSQPVDLSGSTADTLFYTDAGCSAATNSVTIANAKEVQFYIKNLVKAVTTLTASEASVPNSGTLTLTVNADVPVKLAFAANLDESIAGQPLIAVGPTSVKVNVLDQYNNLTSSTATVAVDMEPTNPNNASVTLAGTKSLAAVAGVADYTTINITKAGTGYSLRATSTGLTSVTSNLFNVVASGPTQLTISSPPHTVVAGQCSSASTATLLDQYGNDAVTTGDLAIDLSGTNMTFYSDASCTTPLSGSQLVILDGQSSGNFYYRPTESGTISITAERTTAPILSAGSQDQTVVAGPPSKIGFGNSARTDLVAGICAGALKVVEVELQDQYGNRAVNAFGSALTVTMSGIGAQTRLYSDNTCTTEVGKSGADYQVLIPNGGQYFSLFIQDTEAHSFPLTVTVSEQPWTENQTETVGPAAASKLAYISAAQSGIVAGTCSGAVSIQAQDSHSNPSAVAANTTVNLSSDVSMAYFSDAGCTSSISNVQLLTGTHSGTFYFRSTLAGSHDIEISGGGLTLATQTETVTFAAVNKLGFSQQPTNTVAGTTIVPAVRVDALDQYGNIVTTFAGTIDIEKAAAPAGGTLSGTLSVGATSGRSTYADLSIEKANTGYSLIATSSGLISATSNNFNIISDIPADLFFVSSAQTMDVKNCSAATSIGIKDPYGNETIAVSPIAVALSGDGVVFYSDSSCSTVITSSTILAGQGQTEFWFNPSKAGSITISGVSAGLTTTTQIETVIPGVPSKMAIVSPPQTVRSGECSAAVDVQVQDADSNPTPALTNISALMIGTNYTFYSDATCTTPVTSVNIDAGQTTAQVWFKGQSLGNTSILAFAGGLASSAPQEETIVAGYGAKLAFTTSDQTLMTNECSALTEFEVRDINSNVTTVEATVDVDLTSTAGLVFYSDSACTNAITTTQVVPNTPSAGQSKGSFYFKTSTVVGDAKTTISVFSTSSVDADRFKWAGASDELTHNVIPRPPSQISMLGNGQTVRVSLCSGAVTLQTQDSLGNQSSVTGTTDITLSASHSTVFYSDANCTTILPSSKVTLGSGQNTGTFYFKSLVSATVTITASATIEGTPDTDSDPFVITPASASKLVFTANPVMTYPVIKVDNCVGIYSTELRDRFGNVATADVDYEIVLSSSNANYYTDAACSEPIVAYPPVADKILKISVGQSSLPTFYMKTTVLGFDSTILSSNSGLENAYHSFIAFPATASRMAFVSSPLTMTAGVCSPALEMMTTDHLGYESGVSGGIDVNIGFTPAPTGGDIPKYGFYSDAACTNAISSISIPDGQSRGQFYYKVKKSGNATIQMTATDTVSDPDVVFPTVNQLHMIKPAPAIRFTLTAAPTKVSTDQCSSPFMGHFYDSFDNIAEGGVGALFSATPADVTFYSNSTCTNQIVSSFGVAGQRPFYIKSSVTGFKTLGLEIEGSIPDITQNVEVVVSTLPKVAFSTPASPAVRVGYDFCSPAMGIQVQDAGGTPTTVADPAGLTVSLSANWVEFFSSSDCSSASKITSVHIPQNSGTANFYFRQSSYNGLIDAIKSIYLDVNSINLNAPDYAGETYTFEVLHLDSALPTNAPTSYSGGSQSLVPQKMLLDSCVAMNSKFDRRFEYPLSLSITGSPSVEIYSDSNCSSLLANPQALSVAAVPTFYVKPIAAGAGYFMFSEPHLNSGVGVSSLPVDVKEYQISIGVAGTFNFTAGVCTAINVQTQDHLGNAYNVASDLNVPVSLNGISSGSYTDPFYGRLYADSGCTTLTSSALIPAGQNSKTIYIRNTVAPDDGIFVSSVSDSRFLNLSKLVRTVAAAPTKLALRQVFNSSQPLDSVTMGACSPALAASTMDAFGNTSKVAANTVVNLSAQEVNTLGDPAGAGYPESGVTFYTDNTCTTSVSSVTIASGTSETPDFFFKTNFGRKQFALIADSSAGSTHWVLSSAMDQMAFSSLPTSPNEEVYECRAFSVRHQTIGAGDAIDPEKQISFKVESIEGYSNLGYPIYNDSRLKLYRNADCSDGGVSIITDTITPLTGSPTQAAIEANVTRTYYMISKTLGPAWLKVSSSGRATSNLFVNSRPPVDSKIVFRGILAPVEAGVCSGSKAYQVEHIGNYGSITIEYVNRIELGLRTSAATGSRLIYGGSDSVVDLNSGNLKFYSDPDCNTEITNVRIGANQEISGSVFFKSTKAGPNEASGVGQVASAINGMTGRAVYSITPGPAYQIGFGSEPQTIRAGDCSEPLVLQVQDRYGNEQSDTVQNEVSFLYPAGLTLHGDSACGTNLATTFIPANQSRKSVWFRHTTAGNAQISPLPVRQLNSVPQTQKILSGAAAFLRMATAPQTVPKGICSGVVTVQVQDQPGNPVNVASDTILNLVGEAGAGTVFYSASDCRPTSETTTLTVSSGTSSKDFYFIAFKEGALPITVKNADYVDAKQSQNITAGLPSTLALLGDGQTLLAGRCSNPVRILVQDAYGAETGAIVNTSVSLLGTNMQYFSDERCLSAIANVSLSIGDTQKTVYFKNNIAGNAELRVVDTGQGTLAPATQNQVINPTIMTSTQFLTTSQTLPSGRCSSGAEIGVFDQYGNQTKVNGSLLLSFTTPSMQIFSDPTCAIMVPGNQISLGHLAQKATFYFSASQVGTRTISVANDKLLDPTSQAQTFVSGAASKLALKTPIRSVGAGECSAVMTLATDDAFNQETNAGQDYTVTLTPPIGGQFYSTAGCSGGSEISTALISTGTSRVNVYLKAPATLGTLTSNFAAAGLTATSQNVTVTGAGPAQLVFISAPKTGVVVETCSTQLQVGIQDSFGNTSTASSNITVNLASAGGLFYSDLSCSTAITSVTIPNGQSSRGFYFKPSQVGSVAINTTATGLTGASQNQGVVSGAATKLVFTSSAHTLTAGTCAVSTIESQDSLSNASAPAANRTISLASSGAAASFYSSLDCSGGATGTLTQLAGSGSVSFSFRVTASGSSNFTGSGSGLAQALQTQTINPGAPVKLAFATAPRTVVAGLCSLNATVQSQDIYSNPSVLGSNTTVSLSGAPLAFYSDSNCTSPVGSVDIASGTHSATFYFKTTTSGLWTIDATGGGLTAGAQQQTVNSDVPNKLAFINSPLSITAGTCSLLSMQFQDVYNNPSSVASAKTVSYQMSGVSASIYSDAGCTSSITSQNVATGHSFSAYFRSPNTGLATVRISATGVDFADQTETMQAGAPTKIAFVTSSLTVDSGQCSGVVGPVTIQVQDALDNPSGLGSPGVFNISGTGYTFYSDVGCTNSVSTLPVGTGAHTASFYFRKTVAGASNLTAAMTGFTSVNQSQTVNALGVSKLGMSSPTQTIPSATCSAVIVQTQDANGNPVVRGSATTVNLTVLSGTLSVYSNAGCSIPATAVNMTGASADAPTIYVRSNTSGTAVLQVSDNGGVLNNGSQTITVTSGAASAIAFVTGDLNSAAGACSGAVTVQARDSFGNPTTVGANRTVNLSATPAVVPSSDGLLFYTDAGCANQVSSVVISSGSQSVDFYYKAFRANAYTVSAATAGFTTVQQAQTVVAGPMSSLVVAAGANQTSLPAGSCSAVVQVQGRDTYNNAAKPASNATFNLTGTNLNFYSDSGCSSSIPSVTILTSGTTASFYFRSTVVGSYTVNIAGPFSTSTSTTIVPGTPSILEIVSPVAAMNAGACSTAMTVRTKDLYGHYSNLSGAQDVALATTPSRGQLYSDFGCLNALPGNEVTISAGSSTSQQFFFKNDLVESVNLNADLAGFVDGDISINVTAAGPMVNIYDHPAAQHYPSGSSFDFGLATIDTEKSFYIKNDGAVASGVLSVQLDPDLVNPAGVGSATMWSLKTDMCSGQTLGPGASCLVTVEFRAQSGSKPSGDFYYSNMRIQAAPVAGGAGTADLRLFGIKQ